MRIGVIGYGWSGSSALVNFLEKNPEYLVYPGELSFMWDSNGVIDLYKYLIDDFNPYDISRKLLEFETLINICARKRHFLNPNGTGNASLLRFKAILFERLNIEYIEFSQRNLIVSNSIFEYAFFKIKDLVQRKKYPWMCEMEADEIKVIFRKSLDDLFHEINPNNSLMIFDQPSFVNQTDVAVELLQLDYLYVVKRNSDKILQDMVDNNSMHGVIQDIFLRHKVFTSWMNSLLKLEFSSNIIVVSFESFVQMSQSDLLSLFPFFRQSELIDCIKKFDWNYSRGNA